MITLATLLTISSKTVITWLRLGSVGTSRLRNPLPRKYSFQHTGTSFRRKTTAAPDGNPANCGMSTVIDHKHRGTEIWKTRTDSSNERQIESDRLDGTGKEVVTSGTTGQDEDQNSDDRGAHHRRTRVRGVLMVHEVEIERDGHREYGSTERGDGEGDVVERLDFFLHGLNEENMQLSCLSRLQCTFAA
jgi:hypothetical protein